MKTAADVLKLKPHTFNYVEPDALVADALNLMSVLNRSFLVVMHYQHYRGIFCEHDYVKNVVHTGWDPNLVRVEDVMTHDYPAASPTDSVLRIMELMESHHARYIPVFTGLKFEGVITLHDIVEIMLRNKEEVFEQPVPTDSDFEHFVF